MQLFDFNHLCGRRIELRLGREAGLDAPADHHLHQPIIIDLRGQAGADQFPVAKDGDAVANLEYFFEVVRNEDDCHALTAQLKHDLEQMFGLGRRQRGGRLVEHENAGIKRQRLGDFHELLLGDR